MMYAADFRRQAWQRLSGRWGTMVVITLLYCAVSAILAYTFIGSLLLSGVFALGLASVTLSLTRLGEAKAESLFDGFKFNFTNAIVASALYNVFLALWTMLFVIPGLVKYYSYSMTFYILRDNPDMPANDAITASRQMMDGHKLRLFCLHLSFIGWILLAILTLGIGFLFVFPYMQTAQAAFYEDLRNRQRSFDYFGESAPRDYFGENK